MKRKTLLVTLVVVIAAVLLSAFAFAYFTRAQTDFNAFSGNPIPDNQIDGNIGSEWDDAGKSTVSLDPQGTAEVLTKNDGTNLYIAVRFTADSNDPWIAIQLGGNSCMQENADAALFGNNLPQFSKDGYSDCHLSGTGGVKPDDTQNGKGAMTVTSSNVVTVELKKPLNSGDAAGKDISWVIGETQNLVIVWNSNERGSSGGTTSHYGNGGMLGTATVRTILLNSAR